MPLTVSQSERAALATAQQQSRNVRHWRRYQAVLLRAEGMAVKQVAQSLGCTETSVYNWSAAYRQGGVAGVHEGKHPGAVRHLDAAGEATLNTLLQENDPQTHGYQATGWTVPLLATELVARGSWLRGERADDPAHAASLGVEMEAAQVCVRAS